MDSSSVFYKYVYVMKPYIDGGEYSKPNILKVVSCYPAFKIHL